MPLLLTLPWLFSNALTSLGAASSGSEPNPPVWPASVHVFSPGDDAACASVAASIFSTNGGKVPTNNGQFVSSRHALLFKPGAYSCAVPVGFYTQVGGIGHAWVGATLALSWF